MSAVDTPAYHIARIRELHTELDGTDLADLLAVGRLVGAIGYHLDELERVMKP